MLHYVQYHNPERYGPPGELLRRKAYYVATRKRTKRLPGSLIWLILGEGRPRRYFLYQVFRVDWVEPSQDSVFTYWVAGLQGVRFGSSIELNGYPWFLHMKRSLGNFSLGLTDVTKSYSPYLISIAGNAVSDLLKSCDQ